MQPGATLVLGETDPELLEIFEARDPGRVVLRDRDFAVRSPAARARRARWSTSTTPTGRYDELFLPLHGAHQADNAAIALTAAECFLGERIAEDIVAEAFASVRSPGRLEVVGRQPLLLLDGAHNVAGAQALRRARSTRSSRPRPRTLVVGLLREKEPHEMLEALGATSVGDGAPVRLVCTRRAEPARARPDGGRERGDGPRLSTDDQIDVCDSDSGGGGPGAGGHARRRSGDRDRIALHRRCRPLRPGPGPLSPVAVSRIWAATNVLRHE